MCVLFITQLLKRAVTLLCFSVYPSANVLMRDTLSDHLYGDIDRTGYDTPAPGTSGFATPLSPRNRSTSVDDLASVDSLALQHRLNALGIGEGSTPAADGNSQIATPLPQNFPFRRTSDDEHVSPSGFVGLSSLISPSELWHN